MFLCPLARRHDDSSPRLGGHTHAYSLTFDAQFADRWAAPPSDPLSSHDHTDPIMLYSLTKPLPCPWRG